MIKYFLVPVSRGDKLSKEIVKEYIEKNAINKLEKEIENDNELELLWEKNYIFYVNIFTISS